MAENGTRRGSGEDDVIASARACDCSASAWRQGIETSRICSECGMQKWLKQRGAYSCM